MGKKQHSKDQLYLTATEWQADWGGKKHAVHLPWKTLPYDCCAISFRPFETPMCTKDGSTFDLVNIVPYLKKFKRHPVTGEPLAAGDLIKLKFHNNAEGKHHCPVLFKVFNQHTHIVAIRPTGNVYCHEAVKELNLKAKCMRDLIDDTPFTREDIIVLQARLPPPPPSPVPGTPATTLELPPRRAAGPKRRLAARAHQVLARHREPLGRRWQGHNQRAAHARD